jgi:hypothetical protein
VLPIDRTCNAIRSAAVLPLYRDDHSQSVRPTAKKTAWKSASVLMVVLAAHFVSASVCETALIAATQAASSGLVVKHVVDGSVDSAAEQAE